MAVTDQRATFEALLCELVTDPQVVEEIVAAARSHAPEIARLSPAESRRHVMAVLAAGRGSIGARPGTREPDFAAARRLGADRADQGISLAGLLRGVQAGRRRAVETAVARGRDAGIPDALLLEALLDLDRYADALQRALVEGYRRAEQELLHSREAAGGRRLLHRLLLGEAAALRPEELARYGLRTDGLYHCLVADAVDAVAARLLERRLTGRGALAGVVEGRLVALVARLPADGLADAPMLVVAAPARPLEQAPLLHQLCVAALRAGPSEPAGLHRLVDLAAETALAAQPVLAELLGDTLLGALDPADEFHRELAATALAYLDHGQRLDHTAVALHVHPNTVRYRLHRIQQITGMPPTPAEPGARWSVPQTVRWWWALRTWVRRT
ncbi:PucR family transcriptional regulator [Melissospora conviva]|uniref:PucR family transcriptional regulator n=1 Tax=Melissospora conviva TaxID=3388432 RepID=UPI003C2523ED